MSLTLLGCLIVVILAYTLVITCKCRQNVVEGCDVEANQNGGSNAIDQAQEAREEQVGIQNENYAIDFNEIQDVATLEL